MKVAFKETYKNYSVTAYYLGENNPNAKIVVKKDNTLYKEFLYPAYRIYNIQAHFGDMVENTIKDEEAKEAKDDIILAEAEDQREDRKLDD